MQDVSEQSLEIARKRYQAGRIAFENGQYREAIENLEKASALLARNSRLGGEAQLWLVTAYEAAGRNEEAIALCKQLQRHPYSETNKQARRLLYILQAPKLKRPSEWMTEIPDLGALSDNESKMRVAANSPKPSAKKKPAEQEFVDLSQVNTKDNRFIWVAIAAIGLILSYLTWLAF
ncbi:tetratricopeptide repeat protein [Nostoc sp. FACHB-87]|uniref:tetratricopeptide repeat protein n=1 Tax=Nostocaceae TaxID=1162 RepID=UPI001682EBE2|nr:MULTISPECIES: tetratricopeptide repeat protein [Nostocaceae]MBD2301995.1 tetratricopeptide repeat protein [Nostoc sp. FACHB-190]MBD2454661.1 tetratricopeptide repeat protein [Nostoc sp. FACHB-87]MBD2475920.1 tetratricopeptide repeat protein [Anabaena sp. FACHB-83]